MPNLHSFYLRLFYLKRVYGSGCSWLLPGSLSFEAKKLEVFFPKMLEFFPKALEFYPKHWSFEVVRYLKNGCVL